MGAGRCYPFTLACVHRSLFRTWLPIDLKIYPDVELLGYMIAIFNFKGIYLLLFQLSFHFTC